ncbi:MAG TPA: TetR family transcriptional regulator [Rhodoblastus sp.]|nr:TetR family transcriptional regulator [Rhodoblastus sp.]
MRLTREKAAENRAKVVDAALGLFQRRGFSNVGVAELMGAAGLTHGGFYNHFDSKADLEAEACGLAFERALGAIGKVAAKPKGAERRAAMRLYVERYLSTRARDAAGASCPMVAFGADVSRETREVQAKYAEGLRTYLDLMAQALQADQFAARAVMAELVGALSLARSVARQDRALSDGILETAKERVLARL